MPKSRLYILYALVALFVVYFLWNRYRTIPSTPLGTIEIIGPGGNETLLSDEFDLDQGKPVVINYFAHWCGPCMAEIPALIEYYENNKEEVILIGLTDDSQEKIHQMAKSYGITYYVYKLSGSLKDQGIHSIPATAIYDEQGERRDTHFGILSEAALDQKVQAAKQ